MEIIGTEENDWLVGGTENDTITGLGGDDDLGGVEGNDSLKGGSGDDSLWGGTGNDVLDGGSGSDLLVADEGDDTLYGGTGRDYLYGGEGADLMNGGWGDDDYYVDNIGDRVIENNDAGNDSVYASISYTIGARIEAVFLENETDINATGDERDNGLYGNGGSNLILGLSGNDTLSTGWGGNDTLEGGEGNDELYASVDSSVGQALMYGGLGNDFLMVDGGAAAHMYGGAGDDNYVINGASGFIFEAAGEGYDEVYIYNWSEGQSFNLLGQIEKINYEGFATTIVGSDVDNSITTSGEDGMVIYAGGGNDFIDTYSQSTIYAGDGNDRVIASGFGDVVYGGAGNDTLGGAEGSSTLYGEGGKDIFRLGTLALEFPDWAPVVNIGDFNGNKDTIMLMEFDHLSNKDGVLASRFFRAGEGATAVAQDANDYVIFDRSTGNLYYDPDANGAAEQVLIAVVNVEAGVVNHNDFVSGIYDGT